MALVSVIKLCICYNTECATNIVILKNSRANLEILKQQLDNTVLRPSLARKKKLEGELDYIKQKETITELSNENSNSLLKGSIEFASMFSLNSIASAIC